MKPSKHDVVTVLLSPPPKESFQHMKVSALSHYRARIVRRVFRMILPVLGRDLTNAGERVDIHYNEHLDASRLDMYQKSHYARYEFACRLLGQDMLVGDMACGTGYGSVMMGNVVRHVYGYDIAPMVEKIKERYAKYDRVTFQRSDLLALSDVPKLDAIVSFETVEHFAEPLVGELFQRFNTLLREEGMLIFSVPFRQPPIPAARKHHKVFEIDEAKAIQWANNAGFQVQNFFYQNYLSHEILASLEGRDFMICLCRRNRTV